MEAGKGVGVGLSEVDGKDDESGAAGIGDSKEATTTKYKSNADAATVDSSSANNFMDELSRIRHGKRLAMNRESARSRRSKRKKLIENLEHRVANLSQNNQNLQQANRQLAATVTKLEADLALAKATILSLMKLSLVKNQEQPQQQLLTRPTVLTQLASPDLGPGSIGTSSSMGGIPPQMLQQLFPFQGQQLFGKQQQEASISGQSVSSSLRNSLDFQSLAQASRKKAIADVLLQGGSRARSDLSSLSSHQLQTNENTSIERELAMAKACVDAAATAAARNPRFGSTTLLNEMIPPAKMPGSTRVARTVHNKLNYDESARMQHATKMQSAKPPPPKHFLSMKKPFDPTLQSAKLKPPPKKF